jgi:hypothetical protein
MNDRRPLACALAALLLVAARPATPAVAADADPEWQQAPTGEEDVTRPEDASRDATMAASRELMDRLHAAEPGLRAALRESAGYVTAAGTGEAHGTALAVLWRTRQEVFLTFDADGGDAADLVLVFAQREALGNLVFSGRDFPGGAAPATAPDGAASPYPGAVWVAPDIWAYRLEGARVANDRPLPAIRFRKDDTLN